VIDHPKAISEIKNIIKRLSDDENVDQEWDQFSKYFDKVHSDFVSALKQQHPSLTPSESKLCIYLRMNLSTKEIAQLLNISVRGVEISRYRLRKKLQLSKEQNLFDYLIQIRQS
jgi:DNA-binding CsgD family transcriptional regulator